MTKIELNVASTGKAYIHKKENQLKSYIKPLFYKKERERESRVQT